jgi:hypothetical protein
MIKRTVTILSILLLLTSLTSNAYADAICKDGWRSKSSGSGTCSWHGGVLNWLPGGGSSPSILRDYYDSLDLDRGRYVKPRKGSEWKSESGKFLKNRGSLLGKTREELLLEKWNKKFTKEVKEIEEYYKKHGTYNYPR